MGEFPCTLFVPWLPSELCQHPAISFPPTSQHHDIPSYQEVYASLHLTSEVIHFKIWAYVDNTGVPFCDSALYLRHGLTTVWLCSFPQSSCYPSSSSKLEVAISNDYKQLTSFRGQREYILALVLPREPPSPPCHLWDNFNILSFRLKFSTSVVSASIHYSVLGKQVYFILFLTMVMSLKNILTYILSIIALNLSRSFGFVDSYMILTRRVYPSTTEVEWRWLERKLKIYIIRRHKCS